ncbi:hypothetical protein DL93DRAFT_2080577 [Clavulina sp. PMI_390]|nr:hypothetical protein DL93DRAFT_2080577 [Clavulina sp. PMI_390]
MVSVERLRFGRTRVQVVYKPELEAVRKLAREGDVPKDVRTAHVKNVSDRQEHANLIQRWMMAYARERSEVSSDLRTQRIEE